jgi:hypothetical protein
MSTGRKTLIYRATDRRDEGKKFLITEKDSYDAEMWAMRAFCAMANADIPIPANIRTMGAVGAIGMMMGFVEKLKFDDAKILLDDMFTCVQFVPDETKMSADGDGVYARALIASDIQEVTTRFKLRKAIFELHADFIIAAIQSTLADQQVAANTSAG